MDRLNETINDYNMELSEDVKRNISCSAVQSLSYSERCKFVQTAENCLKSKHYISYINLHFCDFEPLNDFSNALSILFLLCCCWLLFLILATVIDNIFCPALKVFAILLRMNEHLAGCTLVAFAGCSPDILTSVISKGEQENLFSSTVGNGLYVIAFIGSLTIILSPFKMASYSTFRDIGFLLFSLLYIDFALRSNKCITVMESSAILMLYALYLVIIIIDQVMLKRKLRAYELQIAGERAPTTKQKQALESLRFKTEIELISHRARSSIDPSISPLESIDYSLRLEREGSSRTHGSVDIASRRTSDFIRTQNKFAYLFSQFLQSINPLDLNKFKTIGIAGKAAMIIKAPIYTFLLLAIPVIDYELPRQGWSKLLNCIQIITTPLVYIYAFFGPISFFEIPISAYSLLISVPVATGVLIYSRADVPPSYHVIFGILSCIGSVSVVVACTSEVSQIFNLIGIVTGSSSAFLGSTVLAWGMSLGVLVSNVTLAKRGYQRMGFAACLGYPMIYNILIMGGHYLYRGLHSDEACIPVPVGDLDENCVNFMLIALLFTLFWMLLTNCHARRSVGIFLMGIYFAFLFYTLLGELSIVHSFAKDIRFYKILINYDWNRSISEPDLTDPFKKLNRFIIKHPHEYIAVDDLKYFRRKKPPDHHSKSNICLYDNEKTALPIGSLDTEYRSSFHELDLSLRPQLLRRSTSLHLEGLMHHISEHQEQYHWYDPKEYQSCRAYPIKNPENLRVGGEFNMKPEYRSSYISYPMVDRTMKILPREMFRIDPDSTQVRKEKDIDHRPEEAAAVKKLTEDKFKRDLAAQEQHKCHLQQRAADTNYNTMPSEYKRQFVQYPIEKAHSIPQISHIKIQGDFRGVPEYQESFKMYANYSKSAPIKKVDNLKISGAERPISPEDEGSINLPEYRDKFCVPPKDTSREKSLKTDDHLQTRGEFSKILPEYHESFRDPQIKALPERGKCREPYLRLKGKLEFNPEYRNTYLDFPRSRPTVRKPVSTFRLPTTTSTTTSRSPKQSPRQHHKSSSPQRLPYNYEPPTTCTTVTHATTAETTDLTTTPEYRRALTHYQLRERTPTRKKHLYESDGGGKSKCVPTSNSKANRKSSDSSFDFSSSVKPVTSTIVQKRRPARLRQSSILDNQNISSFDFSSSVKPVTSTIVQKRRPARLRQSSILDNQNISAQSSFENVGHVSKKPAKFGRRGSLLQNAANCREKSSIIEGNPKYASRKQRDVYETENNESFVVLNEPCKRSNWMKKSWFES